MTGFTKKFLLTDLLFLKVLVAFIIGILSVEFLGLNVSVFVSLFIFLIGVIGSKIFKIKRSKWADSLVFSLIVLSGVLFHQHFFNQKNRSLTKLNELVGKKSSHFIRIDESPIEKENSIQLQGRLIKTIVDDKSYFLDEKVIVYLPKESKLNPNIYGSIYQFEGQLEFPQSPNYNFEFDYKKWLSRKEIFITLYSKNYIFRFKDNSIFSKFKYWPKRVRDYYENEINRYVLNSSANDVAKSILIGVKSDFDKDLYQAYANTGTIHILSVSGLHFGILVLFLEFLLSKIIKNYKLKFVIKNSFALVYALMTGFSPPVMRSFFMLMFFDLEKFSLAKPSSFNILFLSALLILLLDTNQFFDIGFQLTYLALLGILLLQNSIQWKLEFDSKWSNFLWSSTVTIFSATLFTFPLIIYYFHQISFLGLFSNYIVLPLTSICMYLGFGLMLVSKIEFISRIIGLTLSWILELQNSIIIWFSNLPFAFISNLNLYLNEVILSFGILVSGIIFFILKDKNSFRICLVLILFFISLESFHQYKSFNNNSWYINSNSNHICIAYYSKSNLYIFSDSADIKTKNYFIKPLVYSKNIDSVHMYKNSNYFLKLPMMYSVNLNISSNYFILCKENKSKWNQAIDLRDSFIVASNIRYNRKELIEKLKYNKKLYYEY